MKVIISETKLRELIEAQKADKSRSLLSMLGQVSAGLEKIASGLGSYNSNLMSGNAGAIEYAKGDEKAKYVMPVPVYKGVNYANKVTSPPQLTRTDVGKVKDSVTGKVTERGGRPHRGYDFGTPVGTPILAIADGSVVSVNNVASANAGGKYIAINHTGVGLRSCSMHMSKIIVKRGDKVKKGQIIGMSGATGKVTGPHLHFSLRNMGDSKNSADKGFYDNIFKSSSVVDLDKSGTSQKDDKKDDSKNSEEEGVTAGDVAKVALLGPAAPAYVAYKASGAGKEDDKKS